MQASKTSGLASRRDAAGATHQQGGEAARRGGVGISDCEQDLLFRSLQAVISNHQRLPLCLDVLARHLRDLPGRGTQFKLPGKPMDASTHTCMCERSKGQDVDSPLEQPSLLSMASLLPDAGRHGHPTAIGSTAHASRAIRPTLCIAAAKMLQRGSAAVQLRAAGSAPPAALQQRHCAQQQQQYQHQPASVRPRHWSSPAASTVCASALPATASPPLLDRGCRASPLRCDILSAQKQQYYTQMGAAIRALQKVWGMGRL